MQNVRILCLENKKAKILKQVDVFQFFQIVVLHFCAIPPLKWLQELWPRYLKTLQRQ